MHGSVMAYVSHWIPQLVPPNTMMLDVGSYNVNGSARVDPSIGVDMQIGPGVDIVALSSNLPFPNDSFPLVISTEMLEHDTRPWLSVMEMARVCKASGYLILTARGYDETGCCPIHDYPRDYWRYSTGSITELCEAAGLSMIDCIYDQGGMPGVLAVAKK